MSAFDGQLSYAVRSSVGCNGDPDIAAVQQQLLPGYWFDNSAAYAATTTVNGNVTFTAYKCLNQDACLLNLNNVSVTCAEGYEGPLCAVCSEGFGRGTNYSCAKCQSVALSWLLLLVTILAVGLAVFVAIVRVLRTKANIVLPGGSNRELMTTLKILFNYLQTTSFLADFNMAWPPAVAGMFAFAGATGGFSFNTAFIDCALGWDQRGQFLLFVLVPVVVVVLPAGVIGLVVFVHDVKERRRLARDPLAVPDPPLLLFDVSPRALYTTITMVMLFMVYPTITRSSLMMIKCREVEGDRYLAADMSLRCDNASHAPYNALAWVQLAVVSFGFPILSAIILTYYHRQDELGTPRIRRRLGFLFTGYKPKAFFWESVIMFRKFALVAVTAILQGNEFGHQVYLGTWVLLVSLLLHITVQPFRDQLHGTMEQVLLSASLVSLMVGQLYSLGGISSSEQTFGAVVVVFGNIAVLTWAVSLIVWDLYQAAKLNNLAEKMRSAAALLRKNDLIRGFSSRRLLSGFGSRVLSKLRRKKELELDLPDDMKTTTPSPGGRRVAISAPSTSRPRSRRISAAALPLLGLGEEAVTSTDWVERVHPANGMVYYYNRVTREQRWERPEELEQQGKGAWEVKLHPENGLPYYVNRVTREQTWERPPELQVKEEDAWEQRTHPTNGLPYYVNLVTKKQQWDRPAAFKGNAHATAGLAALSAAAAPLTPTPQPAPPRSNWVKKTDPTTDRAYYFNVATGSRQWQQPADFNAAAPHRSGWKRETHANGMPYYVNMLTRQQQWHRPDDMSDSDDDNDGADARGNDGSKSAASSGSSSVHMQDNPLAARVGAGTGVGSGGTSTPQRPSPLGRSCARPKLQPTMSMPSLLGRSGGRSAQPKPLPRGRPPAAAPAAASNPPAARSPVASTPQASTTSLAAARVEPGAVAAAPATSAPGSPASVTPLEATRPAGLNPVASAQYSPFRQRTSTTPARRSPLSRSVVAATDTADAAPPAPSTPDPSAASRNKVPSAELLAEAVAELARKRRSREEDNRPDGEGWERHFDDESGAAFWFNAVSGESVWIEETDSETGSSSGSDSDDADDLPPEGEGWERHVDNDSGAHFWYNTISQESRWIPTAASSSDEDDDE